jgi:hypothetical protein
MFPFPLTFTFKLIASLVLTSCLSMAAEITNLPTAPLKPGGWLSGNGCTVISTGWLFIRYVTVS